MSADFNAVAEAVLAKTNAETQSLHDLAKSLKAKSGGGDAIREYLNESTDENIIKEREYIAQISAKLQERKRALEEIARKALVPEGFDLEALTKEFKERRTAVKVLLMQSRGTLASFDQDVSQLDEALENLPSIGGTVSASGKSPAELAAIREWANANGYEVADRGRIKADVIAAFNSRNDAPAAESNDEAASE